VAELSPVAVDDYSDLALSEEAKRRLGDTILAASSGLVTMAPLICKGPEGCPFISRCPIHAADGEDASYPLGKQCLVEISLAQDRFLSYVKEFEFKEEDVQSSPTLRAQLSKLADFDVYEYRLNLILAGATGNSDGTLLIEQPVAITQEGDVVEQLQEHPAWKIKERIQRQRMELLDALGATPKRRVWMDVALKRSGRENLLTKQRELLERIDSLVEALEDDGED